MAIVDVIKFNGSPDVFAWKYPNEELGTFTQLIVNESQEAILVKGGKVCDIFGAGRHTLSTENIPILNKIINIPFGGKSPFTAEVWYISKAFSLDVKWGTATPIQLQDPKYGVFIPVRAFGQFGIKIDDVEKFLIKLVGTMPVFDKTSLQKYFRGFYLTKAKDSISSYLINKKISILEIGAYLDEISDFIRERLDSIFEEYGIKLVAFNVNDISAPEEDSAVQQLKKALSKRAEMNIVGYNYQQERTFDTLEGAATNTSSGASSIMGTGLGLGMGLGLGGNIGQQFGNMSENLNVNETKICPKCKTGILKSTRFCGVCGYDTEKTEEIEIKCSSCGAKLTDKTKFCPECGNRYNPCPSCKADIPSGASSCPVCGKALPKPCPSCGAMVEIGMKFCPECGYSMQRKCSSCGKFLEDGIKFCPECGAVVKQGKQVKHEKK